MAPLCYRRHRFPPEIIQHAIWLYLWRAVEVAEVFPAHRYRLSALAEKRNKAMFQRLETARAVFGL